MLNLTMALVVQVAAVTGGVETHSYKEAREIASNEGTPIVVLVGAKWCPACVNMKESVMPKVLKEKEATRIVYAQVDLDQEKQLGRQLIQGSKIPQLVMFNKDGEGWTARRLIGGQSVNSVVSFIHEGVDKDAKKTGAVSAKTVSRSEEM